MPPSIRPPFSSNISGKVPSKVPVAEMFDSSSRWTNLAALIPSTLIVNRRVSAAPSTIRVGCKVSDPSINGQVAPLTTSR